MTGFVTRLRRFLRRGPDHRQLLESLDHRIVVAGSRGKSTTVRRLHDVFHDRRFDVYAKVTGDRPQSLYNGETIPIDRTGPRVTLNENARLLREFAWRLQRHHPDDVLVAENQAISEYTMRLVNEQYFRPDVVFVTNVRPDHLDTLGRDKRAIARTFSRTIPADTHVVNGDQDPTVRARLEAGVEDAGGTITHVDVPDEYAPLPAAESIFGIDEVLEHIGQDPLSDDRRQQYLDAMRPAWVSLPDGKVYNAAKVNDIESTELVRRLLCPDDEPVQPIVTLRGDRRARTVSFIRYVNDLVERDLVTRARVLGPGRQLFARRVDCPVTTYDARDRPSRILDETLADGDPVLVIGNAVSPQLRALADEINTRQQELATSAAD